MTFARRRLMSVALAALVPSAGLAEPSSVLRCYPWGPIYGFRWALLNLALKQVGWNNVSLQPFSPDEGPVQRRAELLLQSGQIDVACFGVTRERLDGLRPIRVEVMRGLVGLRMLVIRQSEQARIARLPDADYLGGLRFGLQAQWADVPIMRANGLQLELAPREDRLYPMLAAARCDALPRGANEVLLELEAHRDMKPAVAVERSRVLYFPFPIYFWVRRGDAALAGAIESGLSALMRSGGYNDVFLRHHAREIAFLRATRRRILHLSAGALPQPLEQPDTSLWWPAGA